MILYGIRGAETLTILLLYPPVIMWSSPCVSVFWLDFIDLTIVKRCVCLLHCLLNRLLGPIQRDSYYQQQDVLVIVFTNWNQPIGPDHLEKACCRLPFSWVSWGRTHSLLWPLFYGLLSPCSYILESVGFQQAFYL